MARKSPRYPETKSRTPVHAGPLILTLSAAYRQQLWCRHVNGGGIEGRRGWGRACLLLAQTARCLGR